MKVNHEEKTITLNLNDLELLYQRPPENIDDESPWAAVHRMGKNSLVLELISKIKEPDYESD